MSYSGKQKCHTIKILIVIDGQTGRIICIYESKGSVHDLAMLRESGIRFHPDILLVGDRGFQGLYKLHANSLTPYKSSKRRPLTVYQRRFNSDLSSLRIRIEHVNRCLKRFKIFQHRYRNKQRKHLLYMSLICGIYNYEI